jgi:hypothetical protein
MSGTPSFWRLAVRALERATEGFLSIVANPAGDDADAAISVHREAHGLVADAIFPVAEGS